jgi:hypothetical protein
MSFLMVLIACSLLSLKEPKTHTQQAPLSVLRPNEPAATKNATAPSTDYVLYCLTSRRRNKSVLLFDRMLPMPSGPVNSHESNLLTDRTSCRVHIAGGCDADKIP